MMDFDFKGKTAIVTGSTRGIGKAVAEQLLNRGCELIITSTQQECTWSLSNSRCTHKSVDFSNKESLNEFLYEIESIEKIDILINNAGIHIPQAIDKIDDNSWGKVMEVNLYAPMLIMREVTRKMKTIEQGKIVNISSIAGFVSKPGSGAYSASKSGLIGLTRASALDMAPYNVLINALCPGHTQTDMVDNVLTEEQKEIFRRNIPLGRFANVEEIANFAVFLCSDLNTYITGQTIIVDGGVTIQ